MKCDNK